MIENRLRLRVDMLKTQLDALRPLPPTVLAKLKEQLDLEWIYNSNAIEGSTLTLRETQLILEQGITIGGKSLREHFEVINHREAITFVEKIATARARLTAHELRQLHQLVLTRIDAENAGMYRRVAVRIAGARHVPPEPWEVPALMDELIRWLNGRQAQALHAVERAAIAHHRFVAIHPFIDGNGRTGRLLLNLILFRAGYPPAVIEKVNRRLYYKVLGEADGGRVVNLVNFVARACEKSLRVYVEAGRVLSTKPDRSRRWISLAEAARGSEFSQEYLSLLARMGRLEAKKVGRNWHTTRGAIEAYRRSRRGQ